MEVCDRKAWITNQLQLYELERSAENNLLVDSLKNLSPSECEDSGISLLNLEISCRRSALYGRNLLSLERKNKSPLPFNNFRVGDEANLLPYKQELSDRSIKGIISRISDNCVEFICDGEDYDELNYPLRLNLSASEATHKKIMKALTDLGALADGPALGLTNILFEGQKLHHVERNSIFPFNRGLNPSQVRAVEFSMGSRHIALIHGPPGTGKTTTVVEYILQEVARGSKLLVCAPSNAAVDNLLEKLVSPQQNAKAPTPKVIRLGHPARINEITLAYSLDALILRDDGTGIVEDVRQEMSQLQRNLAKTRDKARKREMRTELRALKGEIRKREESVISSILKSRDVVLSTLVGAATHLLKEMTFDVVVIDEAAQATEGACWIPMMKASKAILAGDHCQLPPTIKSDEAARRGLATTLFERIITSTDSSSSSPPVETGGAFSLSYCAQLLDTQYRMPPIICSWASQAMYSNLLLCDDGVKSQTIAGLQGVNTSVVEDHFGDSVMVLVDTAGCEMEEQGCRGGSHRNEYEATIISHFVNMLTSAGVPAGDIGVITPYNGQVELLRSLLKPTHPKLAIRSVDGFQGGEKEVILMSLVRSNANMQVGFLADRRRINVAVTRARRLLIVVCDSETCSSDGFLKGLLDYMSEHGDHRSALEYMQEGSGMEASGQPKQPTFNKDAFLPLVANADDPIRVTGESTSVIPRNERNFYQRQCDGVIDDKPTSDSSTPLIPEITSEQSGNQQNGSSEGATSTRISALRLTTKEHSSITKQGVSLVDKRKAREEDEIRKLENLVRDFADMSQRLYVGSSTDACRGRRVVIARALGEGHITVREDANIPVGTLRFPSSMTSFQRMRIHALSETLGVSHQSLGEGDERYVELRMGGLTNTLQDDKKISGGSDRWKDLVESESENESGEDRDLQQESSQIHEKVENASLTTNSKGKGILNDSLPKAPPRPHKVSLSLMPGQLTQYCRPRNNPRVTQPQFPDLDEDSLLDAAIQQNMEFSLNERRKYRVSARPMPNPETESKRSALRALLSEEQNKRKGDRAEANTVVSKSDTKKTRPKKVDLKPSPRNFGGGS